MSIYRSLDKRCFVTCLTYRQRQREKFFLIYDSLCDIMFHPSIQKAETDWYFMYCCCLLPHTVAWGYIIYPLPCLMCRAPFRQNSKSLHYTMGFRIDVVSLSLVTTILCPWCWLRENTKSSFLSIARFVPGCVLVWSILHIDHITQVILDKNGTVMTLQQWTAIFREILKIMLGNCKREPKARSNWMAANPVNLLLHCPASTWHYYLSLLIPTFDFLEHFGWVYVCVIITMCILPQDGRDTRRGN